MESLIFCIQTGIGVGIIAFFMGRFTERRKWQKATGREEAIAPGKMDDREGKQ